MRKSEGSHRLSTLIPGRKQLGNTRALPDNQQGDTAKKTAKELPSEETFLKLETVKDSGHVKKAILAFNEKIADKAKAEQSNAQVTTKTGESNQDLPQKLTKQVRKNKKDQRQVQFNRFSVAERNNERFLSSERKETKIMKKEGKWLQPSQLDNVKEISELPKKIPLGHLDSVKEVDERPKRLQLEQTESVKVEKWCTEIQAKRLDTVKEIDERPTKLQVVQKVTVKEVNKWLKKEERFHLETKRDSINVKCETLKKHEKLTFNYKILEKEVDLKLNKSKMALPSDVVNKIANLEKHEQGVSKKTKTLPADTNVLEKKIRKTDLCVPLYTYKVPSKETEKITIEKSLQPEPDSKSDIIEIESHDLCLPIEHIKWTTILPRKSYQVKVKTVKMKKEDIALPSQVVKKLSVLEKSWNLKTTTKPENKDKEHKSITEPTIFYGNEQVVQFHVGSHNAHNKTQQLEKKFGRENICLTKMILKAEDNQTKEKEISGKVERVDEGVAKHEDFGSNKTKPSNATANRPLSNFDATKTIKKLKTDMATITAGSTRREKCKKNAETVTLPMEAGSSRVEVAIDTHVETSTTSVPSMFLEDILNELKNCGYEITEEQLREIGVTSSYDFHKDLPRDQSMVFENNELGSETYLLAPHELTGVPFQVAQEVYRRSQIEENDSDQPDEIQKETSLDFDAKEATTKTENKAHTIEMVNESKTEFTKGLPKLITKTVLSLVDAFQNYVINPLYIIADEFLDIPSYNEEKLYKDLKASIGKSSIVMPVTTSSSKIKSSQNKQRTNIITRENSSSQSISLEAINENKSTQTTDHFEETNGSMRLVECLCYLYSKKLRGTPINKAEHEKVRRTEIRFDEKKFEQQAQEEIPYARTGLFSDGIRRVDYVLVMNKSVESKTIEDIRIEFLVGLVKTGIQLEAVDGKLPQHKDLCFIKLHATDAFLNSYAEPLGVKKYFKETHEQMIRFNKWSLIDRLLQRKNERELLQVIRKGNPPPLHMSKMDRSYIVALILKHKTFGRPENYFGLQRLLNHKIFLDGFAMHDGPARAFKGQKTAFNNRQILNMTWYKFPNFVKDQPSHLIYEYFGPKLTFFFIFYEYYNKALFVASLWGIFMTVIYLIKDKEYLWQLRDFACNRASTRTARMSKRYIAAITNNYYDSHLKQEYLDILYRSTICAECEGATSKLVCPYSLIEDYCLDLHLMRFFDSPYIIMYSFGICSFALLFLAQWHRIECYWNWMWEEGIGPKLDPRRVFHDKKKTFKQKVKIFFLYFVIHVVVPIIAIAVLVILILLMFVYLYEYTRKWSLRELKSKAENNVVIPAINKYLEYTILMGNVILVNIIIYFIEILYHNNALRMTNKENHSRQTSFQGALVRKYFSFSFIYVSGLVIYFAWFKDAFYFHPVYGWYLNFSVSLSPKVVKTWKLSDYFAPKITTILRRAVTMNCGPFSCFRHGSVVFVTTVVFRIFFIGFLESTYRRMRMCGKWMEQQRARDVPTVEKEYMLAKVTENSINKDFSNLFLQLALIILFAPLFPLAPILALMVNMWDIRTKINFYLLYARRPVLYRVRNLWNSILKIVCYAAPLAHAMTIVRTETFKRYLFHHYSESPFVFNTPSSLYNPDTVSTARKYTRWALGEDYINYLLFYNFRFTNIRYQGFFQTLDKKTSDRWPFQWNYLEDNSTNLTPDSLHYRVKVYNVVFIIIYVIFFMWLAALVHRWVGHCLPAVASQRRREIHLRRFRQQEMRFLRDEVNRMPRPLHAEPDSTPPVIYRMQK